MLGLTLLITLIGLYCIMWVCVNGPSERAKELFGCEYANVQPHSGAQANMAVQFCMLEPGDTVMGMNLDHGGHLTHGSPVNFSGTYFFNRQPITVPRISALIFTNNICIA